MAWSAPSSRSTGDLITAAIWNQDVVANPQFLKDNCVQLIDSTVLTGGASTITFAAIPGTFSGLKIQFYGRSDDAATSDALRLNFNNDVGNNYDRVSTLAHEADAITVAEERGVGYLGLGSIAGANASADAFDVAIIEIPAYARTTGEKSLKAFVGNKRAETATNIWNTSTAGWWRSTAAITEIDFVLGTGDFIAGTTAHLYGLP